MLENQRRRWTLKALDKLRDKGKSTDRRTVTYLLSEQSQTQIALSAIEASSHSLPSEVRGINQIFWPEGAVFFSDKPIMLHVIGMPRAGKSTGAGIFEEVRTENKAVKVIHEVTGLVKSLRDQKEDELDYAELQTSFITSYLTEFRMGLNGFPNGIVPKVFIVDRGPIDIIPFHRANFLFGRYSAQDYDIVEKNLSEAFKILRYFNNALVNMLITSDESSKREGSREKPGRVMSPEFLPILYEQYLRLHHEIANDSTIKIPYVALDMSSEPNTSIRNFANESMKLIEGIKERVQ